MNGTAAAAAAAFAMGLHVQPTLDLFGSPVRVSLADVVALLLIPYILCLLREQRQWLRALWLRSLLWPAASSVVMTYGLVIGAEPNGSIGSWALVKYAGWFALLYFAGTGMVLAATQGIRLFHAFAWTFVLIHVTLAGAYLVLASLGLGWPGPYTPRLAGLMTNPNAYGLAMLCAISLMLACSSVFRERLGQFGYEALTAALCAGILFSRSIGALGALAIIFFTFLIVRGHVVSVLRTLLAGGLIYAAPFLIHGVLKDSVPELVEQKAKGRFGIGDKLKSPDRFGSSLVVRLESNARAIDAWFEAPILGIGLGTYLERERRNPGPEGESPQIHNTPLWLLTEFGIVGLIIFAGMAAAFTTFLIRAVRDLHQRDPPRADIIFAGLLILLAWIAASLVHELMYQRAPWFILGLCAGLAVTRSAAARPRRRQRAAV